MSKNLDIMSNLKNGFSSDELVDDAVALSVPLYAVTVPTVLGINGWFGTALAYAVPFIYEYDEHLPLGWVFPIDTILDSYKSLYLFAESGNKIQRDKIQYKRNNE